MVKIVNATSEVPGMTREEVDRFLECKLNLQLATIDQKGEPNIQPVWFYYDRDREKLTISTNKSAKKTQLLLCIFLWMTRIFPTRESKAKVLQI
jgi:nitroimidazol reductase NimA-like FMN-containing flavoprotein (pyridoxamine 5'-phosphate oxidase superfamily)